MSTDIPLLDLDKIERKVEENTSIPSSQRIVPSLVEQYENLMKRTPKTSSKRTSNDPKEEFVNKLNYEKLIDQLLDEIRENRKFIENLKDLPPKESIKKSEINDKINEMISFFINREQRLLKNIVKIKIEFESSNEYLKLIFLLFIAVFMMILIHNKINLEC